MLLSREWTNYVIWATQNVSKKSALAVILGFWTLEQDCMTLSSTFSAVSFGVACRLFAALWVLILLGFMQVSCYFIDNDYDIYGVYGAVVIT